ncbi:unnamed protein product [Brassica rapa subsp. trilocularis]
MGVLSSRSASSTLSQLHCFVGMVSEVEIQKKEETFYDLVALMKIQEERVSKVVVMLEAMDARF